MKDLEQILDKLRTNPQNEFFDGASEHELEALEQQLGQKLPPSFRQFLAETNGAWLNEGDQILSTITDEATNRSGIIEVRSRLLKELKLTASLIPFHNGPVFHLFDTSRVVKREYGIVRVTHDGRSLPISDQSFPEWLYNFCIKPFEGVRY